MKNKFTILGCGSSLGAPWITNFRGNLKKNKKNIRSRCCAHIQFGNLSTLIDTSPDIKNQVLKNRIKNIDAVIYTHDHADQSSGIFELRPFFWKNKKKILVYGSKRTTKSLLKSHTYCFKPRFGYKPIMKLNTIKGNFSIKKEKNILPLKEFEVSHGQIKASGYIFKKIAYISDCNKVPKKYLKDLFNLKYLILDCLRKNKHPSHFNFDDAINFSKLVNPKKTILTNLHVDLDYFELKKNLPKNIIPAFDGMNFSF